MNKVGGPMRFHVVALPHTQVTKDFTSCAFTEKVRRFCIMMSDLGHEVILYAGEKNEAPVTEHVVCISESMRAVAVGDKHYTTASFDTNLPHWQVFNATVINKMRERLEPKDFICLIGGYAHKPIADAFPNHTSVEFGIGYGGTFAKYRVFESYAWMHSIYAGHVNPTTVDGAFFDAVIPGYLEPEMFPAGNGDGDYYFYIGRIIDRKGYRIAQEVCERLGKRLILAGPGEGTGYGEFIGNVGPEQRAELMGGAIALFAPTLYIEPFGNIAIEAQVCGTPTITTDWGAFTETNINGVTGYRCRTLADFVRAAEDVKSLDRAAIRQHAIERYSLEVVGKQYEDYFTRLLTLWDDGWYQLDTEKATK
jgi:glycosyltransferase involved in cell wall biosynthesis